MQGSLLAAAQPFQHLGLLWSPLALQKLGTQQLMPRLMGSSSGCLLTAHTGEGELSSALGCSRVLLLHYTCVPKMHMLQDPQD